MDLLAPLKSFDRFQRTRKGLAVPIAVIKKFSDDGGGNLAAIIAYYGFFSLFPLLLVFVSVLGFVLDGHPETQRKIVDSALGEIPLIGSQTHDLKGSAAAIAIGGVGALLSGLGVTVAAQTAFNRVHGVPHRDRPNFLIARVRGLGLLVVLGSLQLVSTAATGLVSGGLGGSFTVVGGIVVSLLVNLGLFAAAFRLLTDPSVPTPRLLPGIVTATVLWTLIQAVGGAYIGHVVKGASDTYGTFATVIGLLTWLFLGARVVVYSAEINSVLWHGLWPRALFDPKEPADLATYETLARIEEREDGQRVDVSFDDPASREVGGG